MTQDHNNECCHECYEDGFQAGLSVGVEEGSIEVGELNFGEGWNAAINAAIERVDEIDPEDQDQANFQLLVIEALEQLLEGDDE